MTRGTVAVIVPTRDRADMLRESLQALRMQTRPVDQLIVVDDGSTDSTSTVARQFQPDVLLRLDGGGKPRAVNRALREVRCDYVWIFDDDDWAASSAVEQLAGALDRNVDHGFSFGYPDFADVDEHGHIQRRWPMAPVEDIQTRGIFAPLLERCFIGGPCAMYRRSTMEAVGLLNESFPRSEDYEYILRTARHFNGVAITERPIFTVRRHDAVRLEGSSKVEASERAVRFMRLEQPLFRTLRRELQLEEYLRLSAGQVPTRRALLLQRAGAMASKLLFAEVREDLREIAQLDDSGSLTRVERVILHRMMFSRPYEVGQLVEEHDVLRDIRDLSRRSRAMRSIWAYVITRLVRECAHIRQPMPSVQRITYLSSLRTLIAGGLLVSPKHLVYLARAVRSPR